MILQGNKWILFSLVRKYCEHQLDIRYKTSSKITHLGAISTRSNEYRQLVEMERVWQLLQHDCVPQGILCFCSGALSRASLKYWPALSKEIQLSQETQLNCLQLSFNSPHLVMLKSAEICISWLNLWLMRMEVSLPSSLV